MTLQEFYSATGGNYNEILARFRTDEKIYKYLNMFVNDETFENLKKSMGEEDFQTAFRMAHTLKGMSINMGLQDLYETSSALTEKLRAMSLSDIEVFYNDVKANYTKVRELITQIL